MVLFKIVKGKKKRLILLKNSTLDKRFYGIFVAGGSGTRMGGDVPKQFLRVGGIPILQRTIETFVAAEPDMRVVTVLPRRHFGTWKDLCDAEAFHCTQTLVQGGITRFMSVRGALKKVPDGVIVAVHDGVRPFVSKGLIEKMLKGMREGEYRAAVPCIPVVDTLRFSDGSAPDPDRSKIVAVQTPQFFLSEDLKRAYNAPYEVSFTDDASVARAAGIPLSLVEGERFNIKITTPEDLSLAEAILAVRRP